jgi:hypothetical protein
MASREPQRGHLCAAAQEPQSPTTLPWVTWGNPIRFGDWRIYRNDFTAHPDWLSVAWLYVHEDYDGPEDNRHGFASSIDGCIALIQEHEEDDA